MLNDYFLSATWRYRTLSSLWWQYLCSTIAHQPSHHHHHHAPHLRNHPPLHCHSAWPTSHRSRHRPLAPRQRLGRYRLPLCRLSRRLHTSRSTHRTYRSTLLGPQFKLYRHSLCRWSRDRRHHPRRHTHSRPAQSHTHTRQKPTHKIPGSHRTRPQRVLRQSLSML